MLTETQRVLFPLSHLSFSSIKCFCQDPQIFFKKYVRKEYSSRQPASALVGEGAHYIMEHYLKSKQSVHDSHHAFTELVVERSEEGKIGWGKNATPESVLRQIYYCGEVAVEWAQEHNIESLVLEVEPTIVTPIHDLEGTFLPINIKAKIDMVAKNYDVYDWKFVASFTSMDNVSASYQMQAACYALTMWAVHNKLPKSVYFIEFKKSKNRDGSPQYNEIVIPITNDLLTIFIELYRRVVLSLAGVPLIDLTQHTIQFVPNPFSFFDWEESWADFTQEVFATKPYTLSEVKASSEEIDYSDAVDL